ncbi:MAG: type II secretion system protein [Huintestinicola sp.]
MTKTKMTKGFTLVEVIVALAILGVLSVSLATMAASLKSYTITNNQLFDRDNEQQQYVENGIKSDGSNSAVYVSVDRDLATKNDTYRTQYADSRFDSSQDIFFDMQATGGNTAALNGTANIYEHCVVYHVYDIEDGHVNTADNDSLKLDYYYFSADAEAYE